MKGPDAAFIDGLTLYVRTYSLMRANGGDPMTIEEVIGGLVSVIGAAIEKGDGAAYRSHLIERTHEALNRRMMREAKPASGAVN